jgi:hypothetical protein
MSTSDSSQSNTIDKNLSPFEEGQIVEWKGYTCTVNFICSKYIVLRLHNGALPIVYRENWSTIHELDK